MGRLSTENLHAEVISSSSELFADGHYETAVSEAFKSIEVRVRTMTGSAQSGVKLMGEAFGGADPGYRWLRQPVRGARMSRRGSRLSSAARCSAYATLVLTTCLSRAPPSRHWSFSASPVCFTGSSMARSRSNVDVLRQSLDHWSAQRSICTETRWSSGSTCSTSATIAT